MVCLTSAMAEILPWRMRSNALRTAARSSVDVEVVTGADNDGRVITGRESALASTMTGGSLASGRGRGSGKLAAADATRTGVFLASGLRAWPVAVALRPCAVAAGLAAVFLPSCALALTAGAFFAGAAAGLAALCLAAACL